MIENELRTVFLEKILLQSGMGLDRIPTEEHEKRLNDWVSESATSLRSGAYTFTPYKELLILKGKGKAPRLISIPTVADKTVLTWLNQKLTAALKVESDSLVYKTVSSVKIQIRDGYNHYTKLDISGFFDSINHQLLLAMLEKRVTPNILALVRSGLENPTVQVLKGSNSKSFIGVPQGVPISNVLANFFAEEIETHVDSVPETFRTRYVDDILVLSKSKTGRDTYADNIAHSIRSFGLSINEEKSVSGSASQGFSYLGYQFKEKDSDLIVTARRSSYKKHIDSILKTVFSHKRRRNSEDNIEAKLKWHLNLKITGAIFNKKRYGWLFFFSQIDEDCEQLHSLNRIVARGLKKAGFDMSSKNYCRAHKEIRLNLSNTRYIPDFDKYSFEEKRSFLVEVSDIPLEEIETFGMPEIERHFKRLVFREIKSLERDVLTFS